MQQGMQIGGQSAIQADELKAKAEQAKAQQAHELAKLAEVEAQGARESDRSRKMAEELAQRYGNRPVSASGTGGVSIGGTPDYSARMFGIDDRIERRTGALADDIDKAGINQIAPALKGAEKAWQGGKSVTPALNMLPSLLQGPAANMKGAIGKAMGWKEWEGAGDEYQELSRLMNIDVRKFAGAAQSKHEAGRQMAEKGMQAGGTPDMVKRGMQMMREAAEESVHNIEGGTDPRAIQRYSGRRGIKGLSDLLGKPPAEKPSSGLSPEEQAELDALKKELGQ